MDFVNKGIFVVNSGCGSAIQSIIVCGLPRSGTTGVASALEKAGISMGSRLSNVKEDQHFRSLLSREDCGSAVRDYFSVRRESEHESFASGVKYPEAFQKIEELSGIEGLAILVITRDPFLVAMRNVISVFMPVEKALSLAVDQFSSMIEKVIALRDVPCKARVVILSYEKVIVSPGDIFSVLHESLELDGSSKSFANAASQGVFVDNFAYLKESNLQPAYCIDQASEGRIKGWCLFRAAPGRPVMLRLHGSIGEMQIDRRVECNLLRKDLLQKKVHPTGLCGFLLEAREDVVKAYRKGLLKLEIEESDFSLILNNFNAVG